MNSIKIAWRDIASIFKNRFIRVSVTAIIVVPLLYSLLYLYAFWDPYSKLSEMPVAVVNLDKGSINDGKNVNYGDDLVKNLKDNTEVGWRFVSKDVAEKGVKDKDYYAMFVVPEDFSAKVLSAKDGKPQQPSIQYTANEKKNFLAAQINGKVLDKLKANIIANITDEYTKVTFDNLYEVKDGMQKAADGSKELKDGIGQVKDKLPEMKDGVGKLTDGSGKLKDGLGQLNGNVPSLKDGVNKLTDGSSQLYNGIVTTAVDPITGKPLGLTNGINQLALGLNDAKSKTGDLDNGAGQVLDGAKQLGDGLYRLNTAVNIGGNGQPSLLQALALINNGVTNPDPQKGLGAGVKALNAAVNTGVNGQPSLVAAVGLINDGINNPDPQQGLAAGVSLLNSAVNVGIGGNPSLKAGVEAASNGLNTINDGVKNELSPGVAGLNAAVSTGINGKPSLSSAVTNLAAGAKGLNDLLTAYNATSDPTAKATYMAQITAIADKLNSGASDLNAAVNTSTPKQPSLKDAVAGLNTAVNTGVKDTNGNLIKPSLVSGISQANDGLKLINNGVSTQLVPGVTKLNTAVNIGENGKPSLKDAIKSVNDGVSLQLKPGISQLNDAVNNGINGQPSLVNGISSLYTAATDKTNGLASGVAQLNDAVNKGLAGKPSLINGLTQLKSGTSQFSYGISSAASGANDLYLGANKLSDGSKQIKDGLYALNGNVPALADGISQLYAGSTQLNDGLNTLNGKIPELQDGANKLYDGSKELNDKLTEGSDKMNKNLINDSTTMAKYVSEPLKMDEKPMFPVKNYGTGFAPYFIPLSLWIGALMMFFVITEKVDDDIQASTVSIVIGKYLSYCYIGTIQAILASAVVIALGLRPDNVPLYFLFNIFMSFVFIAIIQSLVFLLGMAGRLLSIILLIFQLTSCAGTFPLEVVPPLFKALNPFLPFTYCVSALREVISGMDYAVFSKDVSVLAGVMVIFLLISVLMKGHADKVQQRIKEKAIGLAE